MSDDPIRKFQSSFKKAQASGHILPDAMALATLDDEGRPTCRMMLLKDVDEQGFVFYTNLKSRKARGLQTHRNAALCFWWGELKEQIRVEGRIEEVSPQEADDYFASRPRGSQIGAWASNQSEVLSSRLRLLGAFYKFTKRFRRADIPRPPHWSGYRLIPDRIEFWRNRLDRLHERVLYERVGKRWKKSLLYP